MNEMLEKEIRRLTDPKSYHSIEDTERLIARIDSYIESTSFSRATEKLRDMGTQSFRVEGTNYYGRNGNDEHVYGIAFIEQYAGETFTF